MKEMVDTIEKNIDEVKSSYAINLRTRYGLCVLNVTDVICRGFWHYRRFCRNQAAIANCDGYSVNHVHSTSGVRASRAAAVSQVEFKSSG